MWSVNFIHNRSILHSPLKIMANKKLLYFGIILAMIVWGVSWSSGKVLSEYGQPISIAFIRYIIVFTSSFLLVKALRIPLSIKKNGIKSMIIAGILMTVYSVLFMFGLKKGNAGAGGILVTTMNPVFAYIIGLILEKRLPNKFESIGLTFGILAGLVQLRVWANFDLLLHPANLYLLAAAFSWAVMSKITSKAEKYGNSLSYSLWMYLVTGIGLAAITDYSDLATAIEISDTFFWSNMIFFGAITTTMATSFYFYATTQLGAEKASSFILLVPMATGIGAFLFLGEEMSNHTIIGGLVGILAVFVINRSKKTVEVQ